MNDFLLVTPPFTQLNTPYPATPYLKGFLNTKGLVAYQMDLGLEVILDLFSADTFSQLFDYAYDNETIQTANAQRIYSLKADYLTRLDDVIAFLQGKSTNLARAICMPAYLPRASRFDALGDLEWTFGTMGLQDKAKHLATLFLEDLSDFIVECIDDRFGFSRYAEHLAISANCFDELYSALQDELSPIDHLMLHILDERLQVEPASVLCLSVPFPGNLYSALRCAQYVKTHFPAMKVVMGGGFPNTELRSLKDTRVFEFVDFITLDDGELPLELIAQAIKQDAVEWILKRTYHLEHGELVFNNKSQQVDYKQSEVGTPDYSDLFLQEYISFIEIANPMHSLWSDGRWNKLTMAHGCYWAKCTFCDVSLPYIGHFEANTAVALVDRMEAIIAQTGERGFHFVDEGAPPMLMKALALEILKRNITVSWWTNVRFEKSFTKNLCALLKASGCIAVSGGLEVASDRLLKLINKGVSIKQVAQVTRHFTEANIMVHAYLMYGFPSQTEQETIDSLEVVRQLFEANIVHSAFWHQFALTAHSPVGLDPNKYNITPHYASVRFANNDIAFKDATGIDHTRFSEGLKISLFNYMQGVGFDLPLQDWFSFEVPSTQVRPTFIEDILQDAEPLSLDLTARVLFLGSMPLVEEQIKKKKGKEFYRMSLYFHTRTEQFSISLDKEKALWLIKVLEQVMIDAEEILTLGMLKTDYEKEFSDFELFWFSKPLRKLCDNALLLL